MEEVEAKYNDLPTFVYVPRSPVPLTIVITKKAGEGEGEGEDGGTTAPSEPVTLNFEIDVTDSIISLDRKIKVNLLIPY